MSGSWVNMKCEKATRKAAATETAPEQPTAPEQTTPDEGLPQQIRKLPGQCAPRKKMRIREEESDSLKTDETGDFVWDDIADSAIETDEYGYPDPQDDTLVAEDKEQKACLDK